MIYLYKNYFFFLFFKLFLEKMNIFILKVYQENFKKK
jgi:hypothetical protein